MTRFIHDQFAKDYLEELLAPFGEVKAPRRVSAEVREIDVWFAPTTNTEVLGLLGQLAATPSVFEPFRNAATPTDICNCLLKLLTLRGELQREANRKKERLSEETLPRLWILSPTASESILNGFSARIDLENWGAGIYFLADYLRTAIVVIHQLPKTEATLWLRLLGREKVQEEAIDELQVLSTHPLRSNILKLLTNFQANLQTTESLDPDERSLIMKLSPLYLQWEQEALKKGEQQGIQQGIQQEKRLMIESMLEVKFGAIDEALSQIISPLIQLPTKEATQLIMQSDRQELLGRFKEQN
ncbi:hypothetical protein [Argonema antarcticum]|uniref:hypothetical protein n=1 Tax=Argonema antarcticum TaxID=2942763 RepID=UPI0020110F4F|nr:hypothetical protein [Argonema antarcticum]MCL1473012.1 hypothetical protein [Argonema antarcticum A004/B2]